MQLSSFPSFEPLVNALKQGNATQESKHYRVSVQRHDQLLVLDTYARKWLDDSNFADQANEVIKNHNAEYNASGDFLMTSVRRALSQQISVRLNHNAASWSGITV